MALSCLLVMAEFKQRWFNRSGGTGLGRPAKEFYPPDPRQRDPQLSKQLADLAEVLSRSSIELPPLGRMACGSGAPVSRAFLGDEEQDAEEEVEEEEEVGEKRPRLRYTQEEKRAASQGRFAVMRHDMLLGSLTAPRVGQRSCHACSRVVEDVGVLCNDCGGAGSSSPPRLFCTACDAVYHFECWGHRRTCVWMGEANVAFESPLRDGYLLHVNDFVTTRLVLRTSLEALLSSSGPPGISVVARRGVRGESWDAALSIVRMAIYTPFYFFVYASCSASTPHGRA